MNKKTKIGLTMITINNTC